MLDEVGDDRSIQKGDEDTSSSGEPDLTDSSSEDETALPGGRVRQIVWGIGKFRRVRRPRRRRPIAPITQDREDDPPGLNPSSEEDCHNLDRHDSDDDSVNDLSPDDYPMSRASFSTGKPFERQL